MCGGDLPWQALAGDDPSAALAAIVPVNISPLAIASFLGGLASLPLPFLGPVAVVFGVLALRHIARTDGLLGRGRAITGIVFGSLGTMLLVFIIVVLLSPAP